MSLNKNVIAALVVIACGLAEALALIYHLDDANRQALHLIVGAVISALAVLGYQAGNNAQVVAKDAHAVASSAQSAAIKAQAQVEAQRGVESDSMPQGKEQPRLEGGA